MGRSCYPGWKRKDLKPKEKLIIGKPKCATWSSSSLSSSSSAANIASTMPAYSPSHSGSPTPHRIKPSRKGKPPLVIRVQFTLRPLCLSQRDYTASRRNPHRQNRSQMGAHHYCFFLRPGSFYFWLRRVPEHFLDHAGRQGGLRDRR